MSVAALVSGRSYLMRSFPLAGLISTTAVQRSGNPAMRSLRLAICCSAHSIFRRASVNRIREFTRAMITVARRIIHGVMWPWEAFNWGVFWAILAAAWIGLIVANLIHLSSLASVNRGIIRGVMHIEELTQQM